ncbi:MAG: diacylglycerol kinase family protein [Terriglobales bacterium]
MRKVVLLYNPLSGGRRQHRQKEIQSVLSILQAAQIETSVLATSSAEDTREQSRKAAASGCDAIFACGGDGTVHDVLQAVVGSNTAIVIIPMGTANALAHDLGIPLTPAAAARAALSADARRVAAGRIIYQDFSGSTASRYFTVTAGIGLDAHLFHKLNNMAKKRLGMLAYYARATQIWLTHEMKFFEAEFVALTGESRRESITQLLAVRITQFGGILRELAPGAALSRDDMRLVLFKTNSRLRYLSYILQGTFARQGRSVPGIELAHAEHVVCRTLAAESESTKIYVEADGELLGTVPAEISMVPSAFTLLVPRK